MKNLRLLLAYIDFFYQNQFIKKSLGVSESHIVLWDVEELMFLIIWELKNMDYSNNKIQRIGGLIYKYLEKIKHIKECRRA